MNYILDAFNIATALVALASAIAAVTPTQTDDNLVSKAYKWLDIIALNIGKAKQ
jgi:hypothetical protein|tara:strand:- start:238 stop:399 length:162 start_codon:yes stop_codon:yes gene_type:complete